MLKGICKYFKYDDLVHALAIVVIGYLMIVILSLLPKLQWYE